MTNDEFLGKFFRELGAGGFTSVDGSIEFYGRVQALLEPSMTVLDFGAGRGAWFEDDTCVARREARLIKGKVASVVGCDVDPAVLENRSVDEAIVSDFGKPLPIEDSSIDLIVSDYVFEHVTNVDLFAGEIDRILKPGGWICARTPTKYCYVAIFARLIRNRQHSALLKHVQPSRKEEDVFPTAYKLNTVSRLSQVFPGERYDNHTYLYTAEPTYHFGKTFLFRFLQFIHWLTPKGFTGNLFIFLRKKQAVSSSK